MPLRSCTAHPACASDWSTKTRACSSGVCAARAVTRLASGSKSYRAGRLWANAQVGLPGVARPAILCAASVRPSAEVEVTRDEFVAEMIEALREEGYEGAVRQIDGGGRLKLPDRGEIGIDALYTDLSQVPAARRREGLAKVASILLKTPTLPKTWAEARDQILPGVTKRISQWVQEARRGAAGTSEPEAVAPVTEHLIFKLGITSEPGTISVPVSTLESWGVSPEEAFGQAGQNLAALSGDPWRENGEFPGVFASGWNDGLAASRLFLPRVFGRAPIRGKPVVMAPTPRTLLVAGDEDEDGLFHLARVGRRMMEKDKVVHILRTLRMGEDGESWDDWLPEPTHPAYEELRFLRAIEERTDHDTQAAVLREILPKEQLMLPPPLEVQLSGIGAMVRTVTRWRDGPPQALPAADLIVLEQDGRVLGAAAWNDLATAMPWELEPVPGYPTRHRVTSFPNEWQIAGIDLLPWHDPPGM